MTKLTLVEQVNSLAEPFLRVNESSLNFERESGFAVQALEKNNLLCKVAKNNINSLKSAIVNVANIGLSLCPASKFAYLVPRGNEICLDVSYVGMLKLATDSGSVLYAMAEIVREQDDFHLREIGEKPLHKFNPFDSIEKRGKIIGAYTVAQLSSNAHLVTTMTAEEIFKIRDASQGWKSFKMGKAKSAIWNDFQDQMILKTVIKRAAKLWPRTQRLDLAIDHVNTSGEGIDFNAPVLASDENMQEIERLVLSVENGFARLQKFVLTLYKRNIDSIEEIRETEAKVIIKTLEGIVKNEN